MPPKITNVNHIMDIFSQDKNPKVGGNKVKF